MILYFIELRPSNEPANKTPIDEIACPNKLKLFVWAGVKNYDVPTVPNSVTNAVNDVPNNSKVVAANGFCLANWSPIYCSCMR